MLRFAAAYIDTKLLPAPAARPGPRICLFNARDIYSHTPLIAAVLYLHKDTMRTFFAAGRYE